MQNILNQIRHNRGSYLSHDELQAGQGNIKREFRSIREIPNEQDLTKRNSGVSQSAPVNLTHDNGHRQDDGGEAG